MAGAAADGGRPRQEGRQAGGHAGGRSTHLQVERQQRGVPVVGHKDQVVLACGQGMAARTQVSKGRRRKPEAAALPYPPRRRNNDLHTVAALRHRRQPWSPAVLRPAAPLDSPALTVGHAAAGHHPGRLQCRLGQERAAELDVLAGATVDLLCRGGRAVC